MVAEQKLFSKSEEPGEVEETTTSDLAILLTLASQLLVTCTCGEPLHREFHTFGVWVHPDGLHTRSERVGLFHSRLHDATPAASEPAHKEPAAV